MDFIKVRFDRLKAEPSSNGYDRFSHPAFTFKVPKGITPCDFDKIEKLIEIEFSNGERRWVELKHFFGIVISEAKEILLLREDGGIEGLHIEGIDVFKVKRTLCWKIIFEKDLPF